MERRRRGRSPGQTTWAVARLPGLVLSLLLACDGAVGEPPGPCEGTYALLGHLRIDQASHPTPVLPGTTFAVRGEGFIPEQGCVTGEAALVGSTDGGQRELLLHTEVATVNELTASIPPEEAATLGSGAWVGALEVRFHSTDGSRSFIASLPLSFEAGSAVDPSLSVAGESQVYLNDAVLTSGSGFLDGAEGLTQIVADGSFTPSEGGPAVPVSGVRSAVTLVEGADRSRGTFLWSPGVGGLSPGTFSGTLTAENVHTSGEVRTSPPLAVTFTQQETFLVGIDPSTVSLGEYANVVGRGFIGAPDGTTSVLLSGEFTPYMGTTIPVDLELVGEWERGDLVRYPIAVSGEGGFLHAVDFGSHRGQFVGTATPILTMGRERREGRPSPLTLTLGPVRQVVWVRFLPGFSDSLELFGLGAVDAEVRRRVVERMQEIYCPPDDRTRCINVEFRTEEPEDFYNGGYAIIDIGGPDPNALGLFGYDNTPGKDVGNIRLHDHVGGENALGALDGYGYGGVFIESMLFWSDHPPSSLGSRPAAAPPPDDRFDQVFDPLRHREVVAGEWPSGASESRLAEIEAGLSFVSSMVADTAAHEFGHSLGLAQPFGPPTEYHNAIPREGCLMDAGRDRPLEERARLDGNPGARFCGENFFYLMELLPVD